MRIEAIELFLAGWKTRAIEYYTPIYNKYTELIKGYEENQRILRDAKENISAPLRKEIDELYSKLDTMPINNESRAFLYTIRKKEDERKTIMEPYWDKYIEARDALDDFQKTRKSDIIWSSKSTLEQAIDRDVAAKRKILITRTQRKVGNILDASGLYVGVNGEINGVVVGDKDTARVTSIYAGGHTVQCLHYRVLVS